MTEIRSTPDPVINCHTHIFIGESVPPYFGKTFLPLGLYRVFTIPFILCICRFWFLHQSSPRQWKHQFWYKRIRRVFYQYQWIVNQNAFFRTVKSVLNIFISLHAALYLAIWLISIYKGADTNTVDIILKVKNELGKWQVIWLPTQVWIRIAVILFTILFIRNGRRLLFHLGTKLAGVAEMIPSSKTLQFLARYINIGRFAYYKHSKDIFNKLKKQYDAGSGFVLLPMDMEFMDAGTPKRNGAYAKQMSELASIKRTNKNSAYPFVFIDPRRTSVGNIPFFKWSNLDGKVELEECFIKQYIIGEGFSGFKIYPALGYYPFDEQLLPLWKYAADEQLPIMTHCIRGTVFFRGDKKKEWGYHPVFMQAAPGKQLKPLLLPDVKNEAFCNNFGHPLNYLCLLDERLLRKVVSNASAHVKTLFGFKDLSVPLERDLSHLKLCFGHYGGEDQWRSYFEKDRDSYNSQLKTKPLRGLNFSKPGVIDNSFTLLEQIWKHVDWYSIITSMMLQKENIYADISYIIHDNEIVPLLKQTLQNSKLRQRVLFGTDFYVVRNHKSEKQMLAELIMHLGDHDFDQIARINPKRYLKQNIKPYPLSGT